MIDVKRVAGLVRQICSLGFELADALESEQPKQRRAHGQAAVEEHPKGSGRHRVRERINGRLKTIASGLSSREAIVIADAYARTDRERARAFVRSLRRSLQ